MTTTTPTPALADLDTLTRYGWSEAYIGEESQLIEDPSGTYVRFEDVQALARRAAQPVAPVRIDTAVEAMLCDHTKLNEDGLDKYVPQIVALLNHVAVLPAPAEFATPSPQIAEVAELPLPWRERFHAEGNCLPIQECMQQEIDALRDAIAASRRAGGEAFDALKAIRDLAAFDPNGAAYYRKAENALAAIECRDATPAPASAGQAAPVETANEKKWRERASAEREKNVLLQAQIDMYVAESVAQTAHLTCAACGGTGYYSSGSTDLCEDCKGDGEVEVPAEGAGQAGQVATCTCPSGDGSLRWPCPQHPPERAAAPAELTSAQKGGA